MGITFNAIEGTYETADYTFTPILGMEGPMLYRMPGSREDRVLHYDTAAGAYYDQSVDMYVDNDQI